MMLKISIVCVLISVSIVDSVDFKNCGDINPPKTLSVFGCDEAPCDVTRGDTIEFSFDFTSPSAADALSVDIKAKIFGAWVPWFGSPSVKCNEDVTCPLVAGKDYTFKTSLQVPSIAPSISTTAQFTLENSATKENIFCAQVAVRVA